MKRPIVKVAGGFVVAFVCVAVWYFVSDLTRTEKLYQTVETKIEAQVEEVFALPGVELAPRTITFEDGAEATFQLADDFDISIAAEGLGKARFMGMSPDGRLFLSDMVNMNLSSEGRLFILEDFNEETRKFETKSTYLSGLRGPNSVAFYTDKEGNEWLYLALTEKLVRYPYKAGDMTPSGEPETIATFPNVQSPNADGIVWHITRTILFVGDTLYVSVGSGCNLCEQPEDEVRAVILVMDPDGSNSRIYAHDIKNAVGIEWAEGALYATENGTDHLGVENPDDLMFKIEDGKNYGWPYCYEADGVKVADFSRSWQREPTPCEEVPLSFSIFEPHSAPLGLRYFEDAHPVLEGAFLVALHGSFRPEIGNGYQIIRVSKKGEQVVFMEGFMNEEGERVARAVDILQKDKNSFFMTDDFGGRLFYIYARE